MLTWSNRNNLAVMEKSNNYSDEALQEFKKIIEEKIAKAQKDLELIRSAYMNDGNNGTDDTSPTFKAFEEGSETMSKEANTQLAIRQEKFIRDLKNALIRIENKTYGVCRVTGKLISPERLKLVPHATLSIEAKNMQR
jgi:DnaK suppressor protein|tara:strand:+ start:312 stop:725 length:414 start_codon:yes stop_codon:yes gene_type:complete